MTANCFSMNMVTNRRAGTTGTKTGVRRRKPKQRRRGNSSSDFSKKTQPIKPKLKKIYSLEQLSQMSIAQAIQESSSSSHLLHTSTRLWLPTDDDLPPHLRTQAIHHEKRIKAASQLLQKLGDCIGREQGVRFDDVLWNNVSENGMKRCILAASIPVKEDLSISQNSSEKDLRNVCIALAGLHSIVGYTLPHTSSERIDFDSDVLAALYSLIKQADSMAWALTLQNVIEVRWAIRGILSRMGAPLSDLFVEKMKIEGGQNHGDDANLLKGAIPNLEGRVSKLPFDIIPSCLDWDAFSNNEQNIMKVLLGEIPFNFDTITTRSGSKVEERRGTAWVAEEGVGSLAYSGKLMSPHQLPATVSKAMREVEAKILAYAPNEQLKICCEEFGGYFDCALCNHYPNEESACKFHTDPEHGTYWERLTCVVSAGNEDVRKFAFRPIPNMNEWSNYETKIFRKNGSHHTQDDGIIPAVVPLFPGDCVMMDSDCNDVFHHAVYGRQDAGIKQYEHLKDYDGRVSLVFKRAMDRGNGRKGHGKAGAGRRARRF